MWTNDRFSIVRLNDPLSKTKRLMVDCIPYTINKKDKKYSSLNILPTHTHTFLRIIPFLMETQTNSLNIIFDMTVKYSA